MDLIVFRGLVRNSAPNDSSHVCLQSARKPSPTQLIRAASLQATEAICYYSNIETAMESLVPQKAVVTTEEIKDIVNLLNAKPLNESMTLVTLDELDSFGLGDLLSKIFEHLDQDRAFNSKKTPPVEIVYKVTEFLRVLGYQSHYDEQWQNGLLSGDRKVIYPVYYYLLVNLGVLKKRAYLGKYLVNIEIPMEYSEDPDIKKIIEQNRQLQAEFQVVYEGFEVIGKTTLNTAEMVKEIQQMEQEKEQLTAKIKEKKNNSNNKADFGPLFEATNLLRKEQEEEARLVDKIQSQRAQLENAESQLMSFQQALVDAQKSLAPSNTPEQMLQATKNEVRKNRELVKERMTLEYNERLRKLQNIEKMLGDPPITQNELLTLEQQMIGTRRLVAQMEERLGKENTQGDKLGIFKSQAAAVTKKKEQTVEALKKEEEELESLETEIRKKEEQIHKLQPSMNMNTSEKYLQVIKDKKAKYTKKFAELEEMRHEVQNLKRTEQILLQQKANHKSSYGLGDHPQEHNLANASMDEVNKQIDILLDQIRKKKTALTPRLEQKKGLVEEFEGVEREYKQKKQTFESTLSNIEDEMKDLQGKVGKLKDEVYSMDTKIQLGRFKTEAIQLKIDRLTEESENLQGKGKKVGEHKSYNDYFKSELQEREKEVAELAVQRQIVSDNHQPSLEQNKMFLDLKKLLQVKLTAGQGTSESHHYGKGEKHGTNVNVLRME